MSGPFVDTPLTTGQYFTQTRQRQMNTNSKMAWERTTHLHLPYEDFEETRSTSSSTTPTGTLYVAIDSGDVGNAAASNGNGDVKIADVDVSSLAVGLHTMRMRLVVGSFTTYGKTLRFVRHEFMNRLSVWAHLEQEITNDPDGSGFLQRIKAGSVTVINHESVEGW